LSILNRGQLLDRTFC
jgi:hypothetical protein